jgi:hypothetical protein
LKNVISKSFEIQDYMLDGTHINGFWMNLIDREKLTTEVVYSPAGSPAFSSGEVGKLVREITKKCDGFRARLPENIHCEVVFKDFGDLAYSPDDMGFRVDATELDEIRVVYRFCVAYYV